MNPRRGMVAVPTWFWVEGYGGDVIPLTDNLQVTHQDCHTAIEREGNGQARLDSGGAPITRQDCHTITDTLTVDVRVWPKSFDWSFGDNVGQSVACQDLSSCSAGIGLPFTDIGTPSPIAHAYRFSSLGINGASDAYTVGLAVTFGAQYRFSINGHSGQGWQDLGERALGWTTSHAVQEAQAVLTRP